MDQIIRKYVAAYPQLKSLADRANSCPAARRALGDQIGQLNTPQTVTMAEAWEASKLGIRE